MKPKQQNQHRPARPGKTKLPIISDELKTLIQSIRSRMFKWKAILLILPFFFFMPGSQAQAPGKTFFVNSTGDEHDLNYDPLLNEIGGIDDGLCDVGGGKCTFRAAIENHRKNATNPLINDPNDPNFYFANTIEFDIPLPAGQTVAKILITSFLRPISGKLHIDGTTQPGYDPTGNKIIEIDGINAGIGAFGLWLVGRGSIVEGLSIHSFDGRGILISATGGETRSHTIRYNYIGRDATGTLDKGNNAGGILILGSFATSNNLVFSNLIGGNGGPGVEIDGGGNTSITSANNNHIHANAIGGSIPNDGEGVLIHRGAQKNLVESNTITGNIKDGIRISGLTTDSNVVIANQVGVRGNAALANQKNGVVIEAGAKQNEIGRVFVTGFGYSNQISGNIENGVLITGAGTDENFVRNNQIGTNSDGDAAIPNQQNGVMIADNAKNNTIGEEFLENLISGNTHNGVLITGTGTNANKVGFNLIGTNMESLLAVPNQMNGVVIAAGAKENEIGCSIAGRPVFPNTISGNTLNGVLITGIGTDNNEVGENHIGTDGTGTNAVPNGLNGVMIQDKAQRNKIGVGLGLADNGNDISGNAGNGVLITGDGTDRNEVWYNFIGPPGNLIGILVQDKAKHSSIAANNITQNKGSGVVIKDQGTTNNLVSGNNIHSNLGIGIDLGNDGPTPNDPPENLDNDTGPNELQNFPEIIYADSKGIIKGVLKSAPLRNYRIEIFSNGACDPSGFGEGETYIAVEDVLTDDFGLAEFTIDVGSPLLVGAIITATATDITEITAGRENNTSEFSPCHTVVQAPTAGNSDLRLIKTSDKTSVIVGETISFTITVTNDGPDAATNIMVKDLLPATVTFTSAATSIGNYNNITGNWTISSLGNGAQATLTINATASQTGNITNTAEVISSDQDDPDSDGGNNNPNEDDQSSVAIEITAVATEADLELTKTANKTDVTLGEAVTFTITLTNKGPVAATNINVSEFAHAGIAFSQVTPGTGSYNSTTGIWSVSSLASNSSATLIIEAFALQTGALTNTAEVTASDQTDPDSSPGNGSATEDDQSSVVIQATEVIVFADLELTKTTNKTTLAVGETITFTITLANKGPGTITKSAVIDVVPANFNINGATVSTGSYNQATGIWAISILAGGEVATLTINATANAAGTVTNTAEVMASSQPDPDSSPNNGVVGEDDQSGVTISITEVAQTPAQLINELIQQVNDLVTGGNLGNNNAKKLIDPLENALKQLNKGNLKPAVNQLEHFIKEVNKLVSKGDLSSATAQLLINSAEKIIQMLQGNQQNAALAKQQAPGYPVKSGIYEGYKLYPAAPNPFSSSTRIFFSLAKQQRFQMVVYDTKGRQVVTLLDRWMAGGLHIIEWRAGSLPKGVYVVRLKAGDIVQTQRLIYIR